MLRSHFSCAIFKPPRWIGDNGRIAPCDFAAKVLRRRGLWDVNYVRHTGFS